MVCKICNREYKAKVHQAIICDKCIYKKCKSCGTRFRTTTQQRENPKWGLFCSHVCASGFGKAMRFKKNGYWCVKSKDHPKAYGRGCYYEHILVLEKKIGRYLKKGECTHHIDGNKLNNSPNNLELHTRESHSSYHWPEVSCSNDIGIDYSKYIDCKNKKNKGYRISDGYVRVWNPNHSMAFSNGYVLAHRVIMADIIGRMLKPEEHVHHINGNRQDNRIENLELVHRKNHPSKHFRK